MFVMSFVHQLHAVIRRKLDLRQIRSIRDLSPLYEAFSEEDDERGNPTFLNSSFGFISDGFRAYFGNSQLRKHDPTAADIKRSLKVLPDQDVYPSSPSDITIFVEPIETSMFLKSPKLNSAFVGTGLLPKLILQEAEILELLLHRPHPNIIRYHGGLFKRGLIVGLVFDRYDSNLKQRLVEIPRYFDVDMWIGKITSAISHLHELGLAHNDLTPMNIRVDRNDMPYLIDYGSCQPFGFTLMSAGTPGWVDYEFTHSSQQHDGTALDKLRAHGL